MKTRIYLRVAKNGNKQKVEASIRPTDQPLHKPAYRGEKEFLPTVGFAVDFDIPDVLFSKASIVVAEINLSTKEAKVLSAIPAVTKVK